jgi:hypothetical protein
MPSPNQTKQLIDLHITNAKALGLPTAPANITGNLRWTAEGGGSTGWA